MNESRSRLWSPRSTCCFWLGMAVLPVFWIWWTGSKRFTKRQRAAACIWTAIYLIVFAGTFPLMEVRYMAIIENHALLLSWVTFAMTLWLFLRVLGILALVCLVDVFAIVASLTPRTPPLASDSLVTLIMFISIALLHLAVEPMGRLWRYLENIRI